MKINTKKDYQRYLQEVDELMKKGEELLTPTELNRISVLSSALEEYEDAFYPIAQPKTLPEMVELRLFEKKMSQTDFAKVSGISLSKVNQIIKGNRKVDIPFAKAVYQVLDIPADFVLSHS